MSVVEIVVLVAAGGVGAGARYLMDGAVMRGRRRAFPLGILVVNALGSFLLGLLTGIPQLAPAWLTILGVGLLGGFTTFSAVAVESVLLGQNGRREWAWMNLLATVGVCVVAAAIGFTIGGLFPR
ncbi:fluoride efflux transporter FluC [Microbacterium flavum]|uniref:fluoride efflux transporter FluC n=1 Tax=Microbacterium flavum TaxID=415216 RepID=UPI0024AE8805|nr:CrcB family protein [Microbacterium flavum]